MVDFYLGNSILWNAQIAPDRTIFIKNFAGEHAPGPPLAQVRLRIVTVLPMHMLCNPLF